MVGGTAGIFTVRSEGVSGVEVTATGRVLVDAHGKPVSKSNGDTFRVECRTGGTVSVRATARYNTSDVTVFTAHEDFPDVASASGGAKITKPAAQKVRAQGETFPKQTIVTVELTAKDLAAQATAVCAAASTPGLPVTGSPIVATVSAGLVLVASGVGLFLVRRRRVRFTA